MSACKRCGGETTWVVKKSNDIWVNIKIKNTIYNKKFVKTKIKSYGVEANYFHDKEMPGVDLNYTCLAVALISFILWK